MSKKKVLRFEGERIEMDIDKLIPYELNNKDHPEKQVNVLSNIIDRVWYTDEILIDRNNIIIAWHGRLEAIKKMWYDAVEVKRLDVDSTDARVFRMLHNKIAEMAQTNHENLSIEIKDIGTIEIGEFTIQSFYPEFDIPEYNPNDYAEWLWGWSQGSNTDTKKVSVSFAFDNMSEAEQFISDSREQYWYEGKIH